MGWILKKYLRRSWYLVKFQFAVLLYKYFFSKMLSILRNTYQIMFLTDCLPLLLLFSKSVNFCCKWIAFVAYFHFSFTKLWSFFKLVIKVPFSKNSYHKETSPMTLHCKSVEWFLSVLSSYGKVFLIEYSHWHAAIETFSLRIVFS